MTFMPYKLRLLVSQLVMAALLLVVVLAVHLSPMNKVRLSLRSQSVSTGLLDYGEKGKILKTLGLVYGVRDDLTRPNRDVSDSVQTNLFQKKREKGEYVYQANPGSGFQLPSTLAAKGAEFRKHWFLASLAVDQAALTDTNTGITSNPNLRGRRWERRATVSFFDHDNLVLATSAGVRIQGGNPLEEPGYTGADRSYRLYLRYDYGVDSVPASVIFSGGKSPLKRLVFRKSRLFANELALDIAKRIGALVPHHMPIILYMNGNNLGVYTLLEHVGRRQWQARLGHDNFYFVRHGGTTDEASVSNYRKAWTWFSENRAQIGIERVSEKIDLHNLTRNLFSLMFCGANDRFQEAAVLDNSEIDPRWRWVTWELSDCFQNKWALPNGEAQWQQAALRQVVARDPATQSWNPTYRSFRSDLFAQLLNNSPEYVEYFLRTVTDALNHEITSDFLESRHAHYESLLEQFHDPLLEGQIEDFRSVRDYLKHRPDYIREDIQAAFGLEGVHTVNVSLPGRKPFAVDGHAINGHYSGRYFSGQTIEVRLNEVSALEPVSWTVNGKIISGNPVRVAVTTDTLIQMNNIESDN
jgi:hypothetical protein